MVYEKMVENHETSIRDLTATVHKISVDLNVLINDHKHLKDNIDKILTHFEENKKKEEFFLAKIHEIEKSKHSKVELSKAIKDNMHLIATVGLPALGIIGTILYEIGKYLRNLPVN